MASTAKFRVTQKRGTFENSKGEKKGNYIELGVVFENEKGHQSMKLNALPLPDENGEVWLNFYPFQG